MEKKKNSPNVARPPARGRPGRRAQAQVRPSKGALACVELDVVRVLVLWTKRSPSAAASPVHMVGSPKNDRILKGKWAFKKAGGNFFFFGES